MNEQFIFYVELLAAIYLMIWGVSAKLTFANVNMFSVFMVTLIFKVVPLFVGVILLISFLSGMELLKL